MGAEESKARPPTQEKLVTQSELQSALDAQRRLYEERSKQLLAKQVAAEKALQQAQRVRAILSTPRIETDHRQRQQFSPAAGPSIPSTSRIVETGVPAVESVVYETTAPYNSSARLYPNLGENCTTEQTSVVDSTDNFRFPEVQPSAPPEQQVKQHPRDKSNSRARPKAHDANPSKCPICKKVFWERIFQCSKGHAGCEDCKMKNALCLRRECRQPLSIRNLALEEFLRDMKRPCPNSDGCKLNFKLSEMNDHLRECPFGEHACPLKDIYNICQWKGKISNLKQHFEERHMEHCQAKIGQEMLLFNIQTDNSLVHFVNLGVFNFLVHIKVSKTLGLLYIVAQLISTAHSAKKWTLEMHVYNKNEPRRKLTVYDICYSNNTPAEKIFEDKNCIMIPLSYAATYMNRDTLSYKLFLKQDINNRNQERKNRNAQVNRATTE